jgi:sugar O-acyltransferase (sialic acid O-acetyltransferase NeuD family)
MKKKIAIIGYGDLGKQFLNFLKEDSNNEFVFFDDIALKHNASKTFSYLSYSLDDYADYSFYVALGYHHLQTKCKVIHHLKSLHRKVPAYIHGSSFINSTSSIGDGSFIYPMCNIDSFVTIGKGVLLNNSVCISHETFIGEGCYLSPGVIVSGNVEIGENTFIGSGSVIANDIKIGNNVIIGIGSVVARDLPDNSSAIGNPLRILNKAINLL